MQCNWFQFLLIIVFALPKDTASSIQAPRSWMVQAKHYKTLVPGEADPVGSLGGRHSAGFSCKGSSNFPKNPNCNDHDAHEHDVDDDIRPHQRSKSFPGIYFV